MIDRIEAAGFNAWPAHHHLLADGWLLRFAGGYTKRANSVNYLYPAAGDREALVHWCEDAYTNRGLRPTFRIVERDETAPLDRLLAARGYRQIDQSYVLARPAQEPQPSPATTGRFIELPLDEWLDCYYRLSGTRGETYAPHRRILERIALPRVLGAVLSDGHPAACGLGVADRGLFGFFDIVTDPARRGQGFGTALMRGLEQRALAHGAAWCYLQVMADNQPALRLYDRLGFTLAYRYWYRVAP